VPVAVACSPHIGQAADQRRGDPGRARGARTLRAQPRHRCDGLSRLAHFVASACGIVAKALQAKYADDKQRQQAETMAL